MKALIVVLFGIVLPTFSVFSPSAHAQNLCEQILLNAQERDKYGERLLKVIEGKTDRLSPDHGKTTHTVDFHLRVELSSIPLPKTPQEMPKYVAEVSKHIQQISGFMRAIPGLTIEAGNFVSAASSVYLRVTGPTAAFRFIVENRSDIVSAHLTDEMKMTSELRAALRRNHDELKFRLYTRKEPTLLAAYLRHVGYHFAEKGLRVTNGFQLGKNTEELFIIEGTPSAIQEMLSDLPPYLGTRAELIEPPLALAASLEQIKKLDAFVQQNLGRKPKEAISVVATLSKDLSDSPNEYKELVSYWQAIGIQVLSQTSTTPTQSIYLKADRDRVLWLTNQDEVSSVSFDFKNLSKK